MFLPYKMYCGACQEITEHSRGTCTPCLTAYKLQYVLNLQSEIREAEGLVPPEMLGDPEE